MCINTIDIGYKYAKFQKKHMARNRQIVNKYISTLKNQFGENIVSIYDLFDVTTGALFLRDEDIPIYIKKNGNHPLFKIFDCDMIKDKRKYTCHLDGKLILRGPINYYYLLCNTEDIEVSKDRVFSCIDEMRLFFEKAIYVLSHENPNNMSTSELDYKLQLALMDNIKNSLIIEMFAMISTKYSRELILYNINNSIESKIYILLKSILKSEYSWLIKGKRADWGNIYLWLQEFVDIQDMIKEDIQNLPEETDFYHFFRKYRESDNVLENLICMDYATESLIEKYKNQKELGQIYLLGLNYGGLELTIMAEIMMEFKYRSVASGIIMKRFRKGIIDFKVALKVSNRCFNKQDICIIIDENILTGNTLIECEDFLRNKGFNNLERVIVKYPKISRIMNIIDEGDIDAIVNKEIIGLLFETNYSKLCHIRHGFIFKYMDKLGTFDLNKYYIYKSMFKNGIYIEGSSIDRIEPFYESYFV